MQKIYDIPTDKIPTLVEVFGETYSDTLPNGDPNPQTKEQYANQVFDEEIIAYVKNRVTAYKKRVFEETLTGSTIMNTI